MAEEGGEQPAKKAKHLQSSSNSSSLFAPFISSSAIESERKNIHVIKYKVTDEEWNSLYQEGWYGQHGNTKNSAELYKPFVLVPFGHNCEYAVPTIQIINEKWKKNKKNKSDTLERTTPALLQVSQTKSSYYKTKFMEDEIVWQLTEIKRRERVSEAIVTDGERKFQAKLYGSIHNLAASWRIRNGAIVKVSELELAKIEDKTVLFLNNVDVIQADAEPEITEVRQLDVSLSSSSASTSVSSSSSPSYQCTVQLSTGSLKMLADQGDISHYVSVTRVYHGTDNDAEILRSQSLKGAVKRCGERKLNVVWWSALPSNIEPYHQNPYGKFLIEKDISELFRSYTESRQRKTNLDVRSSLCLRVLGTFVYNLEIMYSLLVCMSTDDLYQYPLLSDLHDCEIISCVGNGCLLWKFRSRCSKWFDTKASSWRTKFWEHLSFAFYFPCLTAASASSASSASVPSETFEQWHLNQGL